MATGCVWFWHESDLRRQHHDQQSFTFHLKSSCRSGTSFQLVIFRINAFKSVFLTEPKMQLLNSSRMSFVEEHKVLNPVTYRLKNDLL